MSWSYYLIAVSRLPYYTSNGWEFAGQDRRYPSHCWVRKERRK